MAKNKFPAGWDKEKVKRTISHYEEQTEDEAVKEDEAFFKNSSESIIEVPKELVSIVREFIARRESSLKIIDNLNRESIKPSGKGRKSK